MFLSYEGLFFDEENKKKVLSCDYCELEKVIDDPHITFKFKPQLNEIYNELVGKTFNITIIGYGNDDINAGLLVDLPEELEPYYINYDKENNLKVPHITTSLSENGKAKDTYKLNFKKFANPITVEAKFGYYLMDKSENKISFDKYEINTNNKQLKK